MRSITRWSGSLPLLLGALVTGNAQAQQDGLVAYPDVYKVQFENEWVRLVRVHVPGNTTLGPHTHPPGYMIHVYFNDAQPIVFEHDGSPYTITRPAVTARSYRVGPATPETHMVLNSHPGGTDYMRVEFRVHPKIVPRGRHHAPPLVNETSSRQEVDSDIFRATRVTIASGASLDVAADDASAVVLIALTEGALAGNLALAIGQERFLMPGAKESIRNSGSGPVQLLRVDILQKGDAKPAQ